MENLQNLGLAMDGYGPEDDGNLVVDLRYLIL